MCAKYTNGCVQNTLTGITEYNDTLNKVVRTNHKSNPLLSNVVDASIVVQSNNSRKENSGICSIKSSNEY